MGSEKCTEMNEQIPYEWYQDIHMRTLKFRSGVQFIQENVNSKCTCKYFLNSGLGKVADVDSMKAAQYTKVGWQK